MVFYMTFMKVCYMYAAVMGRSTLSESALFTRDADKIPHRIKYHADKIPRWIKYHVG